MMLNWWLFVSLIILGLLIAFLVMLLTKKREYKPDYWMLFILGVLWLPMGLFSDNVVFLILGFTYLAIGLANKDKWKEPQPIKYSQQRLMAALLLATILGVLLVLILGGLR
jgi:hypothetical protein